MNKGIQTTIIQQGLGEESAIFMSMGDVKTKDIVMPTEKLIELANKIIGQLNKEIPLEA